MPTIVTMLTPRIGRRENRLPVLLKPTLACNQRCTYCYEAAFRERCPQKVDYDMSKIFKAIDKVEKGRNITLHGGEPLLLKKKDVGAILKACYEKTGHSGIQTNATLIDGDHIDIFARYKTYVGVSFDGPGELNEYRLGLEETSRIHNLIHKMRALEIPVSVIALVSKASAGTDERLEKFIRFVMDMNKIGVTGNLNPCYHSQGCQLDEERMLEVYDRLGNFVMTSGYKWTPFVDIYNSLAGNKKVVCVFQPCDIFNTHSATVILGDGFETNCMRVSMKGLYERTSREMQVREGILPQISQESGGCKDCPWWENCYGGCPSQAIDGDWRNRTVMCSMYKLLFEKYAGVVMFTGQKVKQAAEPRKQTDHGDSVHGDYTDHGDSV